MFWGQPVGDHNPGGVLPSAAAKAGPPQRAGHRRRTNAASADNQTGGEPKCPAKQAHEEAPVRATKAMQGLKLTYDQVHKDLSAIGLVENRLKAKK